MKRRRSWVVKERKLCEMMKCLATEMVCNRSEWSGEGKEGLMI